VGAGVGTVVGVAVFTAVGLTTISGVDVGATVVASGRGVGSGEGIEGVGSGDAGIGDGGVLVGVGGATVGVSETAPEHAITNAAISDGTTRATNFIRLKTVLRRA